MKTTDGRVTALDNFDTGVETKNDTRMGGYGALIGSAADWGHAVDNASLTEHVLGCVTEDSTALIAVVQEDSEGLFDKNFGKFSAEITRFDAAEIAEAERVQAEMARQAKRELHEAKKQSCKPVIEERREHIKRRFSDIKAKFSK